MNSPSSMRHQVTGDSFALSYNDRSRVMTSDLERASWLMPKSYSENGSLPAGNNGAPRTRQGHRFGWLVCPAEVLKASSKSALLLRGSFEGVRHRWEQGAAPVLVQVVPMEEGVVRPDLVHRHLFKGVADAGPHYDITIPVATEDLNLDPLARPHLELTNPEFAIREDPVTSDIVRSTDVVRRDITLTELAAGEIVLEHYPSHGHRVEAEIHGSYLNDKEPSTTRAIPSLAHLNHHGLWPLWLHQQQSYSGQSEQCSP